MTIINWTQLILLKNKRLLFKLVFLSSFLALFIACSSKAEKQQADKEPIATNKEVVSFVYHRFGDSRYPSTNISLADFEAHLNYLKENGYQVLTFSDAIDYLHSSKEAKKTAVITIDDGYQSFYENGLPLLLKYDFPATLFINTESIGGADYMDWKSIKSSENNGIEIGNHTHSHAYFLNMSSEERYKEFENEISKTQQLIEKNTGKAPETFAYPYGELDEKMVQIVSDAGFKAAAAQNSGVIYSGTDLMQCPRFPMSESYAALDKFVSKAKMKALPVINRNPSSFLLTDEVLQPKLTLKVDSFPISLQQMQCFIQGTECHLETKNLPDGTVEITMSPQSAINQRRRTLYTLTVPDKDGKWYWFSQLWINPSIH
ncbi:polysaccharide deacetylase [Marivirga lumbricoides]|uniref:Polysaccharide deacetylase n=1 Tax=Marivirga lumbricoides TaxID=1046115 RepID=A0ABQ1M4M3_9BACT|nr:polysaccharide deacetylase [Marivirga lumbricoides]